LSAILSPLSLSFLLPLLSPAPPSSPAFVAAPALPLARPYLAALIGVPRRRR